MGPTLLFVAIATAAIAATARPAGAGVTLARANQETTFTISPGGIGVTYVTTFNRPAAFIEQMRMDADADGRVSRNEQEAYFDALARNLVDGLELSINGREVTLEPTGPPELAVLNDKRLFRKTYTFKTIEHADDWENGATVEFHNDNYLDFAGNITVDADPGGEADIAYNSLWERNDADGRMTDVTDRDVVFRYRAGTGEWERPPDFRPGLGVASKGGSRTDGETAGRGDRMTMDLLPIALAVIGGVTVFLCLIWLAAGLLGRAPRKPLIAGVAVILAVGGLAAGLLVLHAYCGEPSSEVPPDLEAAQIFQALHRTIYDAFAARTESEIYDTLARGLTGEILDEIYNDVYRSYVARNAGAVQFSIRRVKPVDTVVLPADDVGAAAFRVRYRWRVYGTVTHVGHTHARFNEYEAVYLVRHTGSAWRIAGSKVWQNKRVKVGQS